MKKRFFFRLNLVFWFLVAFQMKAQSVLSDGDWYKIGVVTEGVYKIDHGLLEQMGLNPSSVDPNQIAVYGNAHAGMLPQPNHVERPMLQEYAVQFVGTQDGKFDAADYILFYAHGPDAINYDHPTGRFHYEKNLYVDSTANYFITLKNESGKRISLQNQAITADDFQTTYQKFQVYEQDEVNLIFSGRNWYSNQISSGNSREITLNAQGILSGSEMHVFYSVLSRSTSPSSFDFELDGVQIGTQLLDKIPSGDHQSKATIESDTITLSNFTPDQALDFELTYDAANASGLLDYLAVQTTNHLNLDYAPFSFNLEGSKQAFELANHGTKVIWDITDEANAEVIQVESGRFQPAMGSSRFYVFDESEVVQPYYEGQIENQDLRSIGSVDVLYITHPTLLAEAQRLAGHRNQHDGLIVETVTIDQIFNDFSVGQRDVTAIRDFIKHVYDKGSQQLKYVLMFGDGSFAYNLDAARSDNMVPVYGSRNSIHPLASYSSDDYYGFLEEHEGEWDESGDGRAGDHTLDIGIGRIPVKNETQAKNIVNKIIRYQSSRYTYGNWRNKITFVADDGDRNIHQADAESLSLYVDTTRNEFNIDKIYLDAYPQNGESSTAANQAFIDALGNGSLIVNYIGHGNESQLALEAILRQQDVIRLENRLRMPFLVTATCQIGKYDDYRKFTTGEELILKSDGGAIGLLTSTRSVYSNSNFAINEAFYFAAMEIQDGKFLRLGDIFKNAKNNSLEGFRNRNYSLLADPSMRLAFPEEEVILNTVNGITPAQADTLKALGKIELAGQVNNGGQVDVNFNGIVTVTVYDKPSAFQTLNNEGTGVRTYGIQDVLLFQGDATVNEGRFTIDFIVPKNISYNYGHGKISFYAINENQNLDANGSSADVIVGGSVTNPAEDNTPPEISLFLDDTTFVNGGRVKPSPILIAKMFDESGINLSRTSFGQDISYSLDGAEPVAINEYYTAELDDFTRGWVTFPINNIEVGKHEITLTAFDIYNNQTTNSIEFYVSDKNEITVSQLVNYPNPLRYGGGTTIRFDHDRPGDNLEVELSVVNFRGQEIIRNNYRFDDSSPQSEISWNGLDANGNRVKPGIYIYRLIVQSELDGSTSIISQKLVVSN